MGVNDSDIPFDFQLYQAGSKFDCLNNFNKEQRQEAKTALQEHQKIYAYFHGSAKKGRAGA
jgi:ClpP class serine protease